MGRPRPCARRASRAPLPLLLALLALLAAALAPVRAAAAGKPAAVASIVGGTPAGAGTFGPLAFVTSQISATTAMACTGTVIASGVVLTAAHCLVDETGAPRDAAAATVVTGRTDRSAAGGQVLSAVRLAIHPDYDARANRADVALIFLSATTTAPPLGLVGAGETALAAGGTPATIAGWGLSAAGDSTPSERLLTAATTILDDAACRRLLGSDLDVGATLCAVDSPGFAAATCRGDSGGPLIVVGSDGTPLQAGVTSWGSQSCNPRVPQAFARLSTYAGWIAAQVAAAPTPPPALPAPGEGSAGGRPSTTLSTSPRGGEAAAAPVAAAGWYRGRTAQRRAVALEVAASGRAVASVRVAVAGRCRLRRGGAGAAAAAGRSAVRTAVAALPTTVGRIGDGRRFAARTLARGVRLRVTGRFAAGAVRGVVSASWRSGRTTRCTTGSVAFAARR